jgi:hypothetical protein
MMNLIRVARYLALAILLLTCFDVVAQKSPNQILQGVYRKMMKVKDYSVEASIRADIPLIKILPVNVIIYFKQPDKFKMKSKNIAVLPRQGFSDISRIIRDSTTYTAIYTGKENSGKSVTQIISIIPTADTGDLVLAKFWIEASQNLILKSQLTTRSSGTLVIEYFYGAESAFGLPDKMIFTVDVKKFKIPKAIATDLHNPGKAEKANPKASKKGVILIGLKNYKINQGIRDDFFR